MNFIRNNMFAVVVFALIIAGLAGYELYFAPPPSGDALSSGSSGPVSGSQLLASLSNLQSVTLDPSVFSDPIFVSLVDYGISIPHEPVGRPNPFAPLSSGPGAAAGNAGVGASTVQTKAASSSSQSH